MRAQLRSSRWSACWASAGAEEGLAGSIWSDGRAMEPMRTRGSLPGTWQMPKRKLLSLRRGKRKLRRRLSDLGRWRPHDGVFLCFVFCVLLCCGVHADLWLGHPAQEPLGERVALSGWDNPSRGPLVVVCLPHHLNRAFHLGCISVH